MTANNLKPLCRACARALSISLCILAGGFTAPLLAQPVVTLGNYPLQQNQAGQIVEFYVTGGDPVQGLNFNLQVADGGPEVGGTIQGPRVIADLLTATIFAGRSGDLTNIENPALSQVELWTLTVDVGSVPADGLLARLTFDTTGIAPGIYDLSLRGTVNGDTDFAGVPIQITNGTVTVIPEPGTLAILLAGSVSLLLLRRGAFGAARGIVK